MTLTITSKDLDFTNSLEVISSEAVKKFIIPVPKSNNDAQKLVYPKNHKEAGQYIKDWQGNKIGDMGIVFFNDKDQAWQAAKADGQSFIIINNPTQDQADQIKKKVSELSNNSSNLSLNQIKQVIEFVRIEVKIGDIYNSDIRYVSEQLRSTENSSTDSKSHYGIHIRNNSSVCYAIKIEGCGEFIGPSAIPQKFDHDVIILKHNQETKQFNQKNLKEITES